MPPDASVIVGFSGGPDSLALAALLARVRSVASIQVRLVHVDHGLRPESASDVETARQLAQALGLPFVASVLDGDLQARHPGVGPEEASRRERYVALGREASRADTDVVAIAHHLDDQAETVLLHLLRGSGLSGASAMADDSRLIVPWWSNDFLLETTTLRLWRPLLEEPRDLVRDYATATGLTPIYDLTNDEAHFRRNRLRHQVMPILRSVDPGADAGLARYARIAREEDAFLNHLAVRAVEKALCPGGGLDVAQIAEEHLAVQRRLVRIWLHRLGAPNDVSLDRIDAVLTAAGVKRGDRLIEIAEGWSINTDGRTISAVPPSSATTFERDVDPSVQEAS